MFQNPHNDQKMHLEACLEALRRGQPVISLVLALKFCSKIDIFHRYLYSDFLEIFSKSFKNRIFWSNFIKNHLFTLYGCFLMKFDQKIRFLKDFEKNFKKSLYRYLWNISIVDQNLRAKTREITGSARLKASKNASKCIFWSFWGVWNMIYQVRKGCYSEKANCHPPLSLKTTTSHVQIYEHIDLLSIEDRIILRHESIGE